MVMSFVKLRVAADHSVSPSVQHRLGILRMFVASSSGQHFEFAIFLENDLLARALFTSASRVRVVCQAVPSEQVEGCA